ncbi:hypothetical protein ACHAXS_009068 [Conticribra weissflogii]
MSFPSGNLSASSYRKSSVAVLSILIVIPGTIFIATSASRPIENSNPSQRENISESAKQTVDGVHNSSRSGLDWETKSKYFRQSGTRRISRMISNDNGKDNDEQRSTLISSIAQYAFPQHRKIEDAASNMGGFDYNDETIGENSVNLAFTPGGDDERVAGSGGEEGSATNGNSRGDFTGYGTYGSYSSVSGNAGAGRNNGYGAGANGAGANSYGGTNSGYGGGYDDTMQIGRGSYGGASSSYGFQDAGNTANGIDAYDSYGNYRGYSSTASSPSNYMDSYSDAWGTAPSSSTFKSKMRSELGKPFQTKVPLLPILFLFVVFSLGGMLATAHSMENNPEGTFANCCRVSLGTVACVYGVIYNLYHCRLGDIPQVVCAADEDVMEVYTDEELERMKLRPGIERALDVEHRKALRKVGIEMNKIKICNKTKTNQLEGCVPGASSIQR